MLLCASVQDDIACCQFFCHISAACIQNCSGTMAGIAPIAPISKPGNGDALPGLELGLDAAPLLPNDGIPGKAGHDGI